MRFRPLLALVLALYLTLVTACSGGVKASDRSTTTYDDIVNTGRANDCPTLPDSARGIIPLDGSARYQLREICMHPSEVFVKGEPTNGRNWYAHGGHLSPPPDTIAFSIPTPPLSMSRTAYLSDLIPTAITNGWGPYERDRSNGEIVSLDGGILTLNGTPYAKGLGVHANSSLTYFLGGSYSRFESVIGIDDEVGDNGSVVFSVLADGVQIFRSNILTGTSDPVPVDLNVAGVKTLQLVVDEANGSMDYDHANWADSKLTSAMEPSLSNDLTDTSFGGTSRGEEPYFLPVSLKTQLQSSLDTYGTVELEAAGDYSIGNPDLILRTNQRLIGSVYTKTPDIIVEPGTTNAYVYSVDADISFPASLAPTTGNTFVRVGDIYATNAVVENNNFVDTSRILVDTSAQGYFRNNTFSRITAHALSPQLKLIGDIGQSSYGNTFFAFNFLTPPMETPQLSKTSATSSSLV